MTEADFKVSGVVVVDAPTGRALRQAPAAIHAAAVLGSSGDFRAGDRVYVTMRGHDGGQYAIATGRMELDAAVLEAIRNAAAKDDAAAPPIAVSAEGMRILWAAGAGG